MSCRGVTLQTLAASAAERRRRVRTSPSLAISTGPSASRVSVSATALISPLIADWGADIVGAASRGNDPNRYRERGESLLVRTPTWRAPALPASGFPGGGGPRAPWPLERGPEATELHGDR